MFCSSATLVVLTLVGFCTYSAHAICATQFNNNVGTLSPNTHTCIQSPNEQNVTYNCSIDEGNVVWQLDNYPLIDRDQFGGIMVQEDQSGDFSHILFRPGGITFLEENLETFSGNCENSSFSLTCLAIVNEVNVVAVASRTIYVPGKICNLQATSNGGVINVVWDPADLPPPITYSITITDLDNIMGTPYERTTDMTQLEADFMCNRCEISVTARNGDCVSLTTTISISIQTCPPIETEISCTECDQSMIGITFTLSPSNLPENTTVTLRNDTGEVNSQDPENNKVSFNGLNNDDIYHAEVSVDTAECRQSETIPITRALDCSVTYYKSCGFLKCSFTPGTEKFPWGVQFDFNNGRTVNLDRSEAFSGKLQDPGVAGSVVEAYMWLREGVVDTQRIPTDVILTDNEDEFPGEAEDCVDEPPICGTICIIIVIVVGVLCLILGTLLGALLGYCLYKSYSCKDGKKRVSTELSEKTGKLFDD